jgi:hypothetical protein
MIIPSSSYEATLQFRCADDGRGLKRQAIADLLSGQLEMYGFRVMGIDEERDEGITWVELANIPPFVAQVGIIEHPRVSGAMLAQIYPPLPFVRIWLRKVSTVAVVTSLGEAIMSILRDSSACTDLQWLSEEEIRHL